MIKLIKWNCIDFFKRQYWILLAMAASLILALIPENGSGVLNTAMIAAAFLLAFISFMAGIILAVSQCYRWLERDSVLLELSLPFSTSKILLSKLLVAAILNIVALFFMLQFLVFTMKYTTGTIQLPSVDNLRSIPILTVLLLIMDSTFLLSYLISKSMSVKNRFAWFIAGLLSFSIFLLIITGVVWTMEEAGMVTLPSVTSEHILTISGNLNIQFSWLAGCLGVLVIAMEYVISSFLLQHRYQPD